MLLDFWQILVELLKHSSVTFIPVWIPLGVSFVSSFVVPPGVWDSFSKRFPLGVLEISKWISTHRFIQCLKKDKFLFYCSFSEYLYCHVRILILLKAMHYQTVSVSPKKLQKVLLHQMILWCSKLWNIRSFITFSSPNSGFTPDDDVMRHLVFPPIQFKHIQTGAADHLHRARADRLRRWFVNLERNHQRRRRHQVCCASH